LALLAACGTDSEPALADPPRGQVTAADHDPDETVRGPLGPQTGWWELTVCLEDVTGEPTDVCMQVGLMPEEWRAYAVGDPYPLEGTVLESGADR
jgi:hypothetical protein